MYDLYTDIRMSPIQSNCHANPFFTFLYNNVHGFISSCLNENVYFFHGTINWFVICNLEDNNGASHGLNGTDSRPTKSTSASFVVIQSAVLALNALYIRNYHFCNWLPRNIAKMNAEKHSIATFVLNLSYHHYIDIGPDSDRHLFWSIVSRFLR